MKTYNRRSILLSAIAAFAGNFATIATGLAASRWSSESDRSVIALGKWLHEAADASRLFDTELSSRPTRDIRASFAQDRLIRVDGVLLPVGFCRCCLARYRRLL